MQHVWQGKGRLREDIERRVTRELVIVVAIYGYDEYEIRIHRLMAKYPSPLSKFPRKYL
jgi:hypothetical protein